MKTLQVRRAAPFLMVALAFSLAPVAMNAQGDAGQQHRPPMPRPPRPWISLASG